MQVRFEARNTDYDQGGIVAPVALRTSGVRWSESTAGWDLVIDCEPEQAARMVRQAGFKQDPERKYLFHTPDHGSLKLTVSCSPEEWKELDVLLQRRSRRVTDRFELLSSMHVEWPLLHPELSRLKPGQFEMGECVLRILPHTTRLEIVCRVDTEQVHEMTQQGYSLHPTSDWKEQIIWHDSVMGILLKPEQLDEGEEETPPFLLLHGLENSLAHPVLMRPFPATPQSCNLEELRRIALDTFEQMRDPDGDSYGVEDGEWNSIYQVEFVGVVQEDMEVLFTLVMGLTDKLLEQVGEEDGLDHPGELAEMLTNSLIAGSRVMRAELGRQGYDPSLEHKLGERDTIALAHGVIYTNDALRRACGDSRSTRVWSLPLQAAIQAECLLLNLHEEALRDYPLSAEEIAGDLLLCFDLGLRYQLARMAPELMMG